MRVVFSSAPALFGFFLLSQSALGQQAISVGVGGAGNPVPASGTDFYIDLMTAVGENAGLEVRFEPMVLGDAIPRLLDDSIDVAAMNTTITDERRAMGIEFSSPIAAWHEALVVLESDDNEYRSLEDLRGQPVGASEGAFPYENAIEDAGALLKTYSGSATGYPAIQTGEIVAYLSNARSFNYEKDVLGENEGFKSVASYEPVVHSIGGLMVKQGDTEILGKLNDAISQLRADGTLEELIVKYRFSMPPEQN